MKVKITRRLLIGLIISATIVMAAAGRNWLRETVRAAGETNELQQVLRDEEARAAALAAEGAVVMARMREKSAIAEELIAGRTDLAGAAARFRELHSGDPKYMELLRVAHLSLSDDELIGRNVIDYCATLLHGRAEQSAVLDRLEREFAAMNKPRMARYRSR